MYGLEKASVLNERFNQILTTNRYFYNLERKAKRHEISREYAVCQRKCVTLRYGNIDNANISFCNNYFFWANGEMSKIWFVAI